VTNDSEGLGFREETVVVNRSIALKYLDTIAEQRFEKTRKTNQFAEAMAGNKWSAILRDPMRFDAKGSLRDGRHRMEAFVIACEAIPNLEIEFVVQWNVPEDALRDVDQGTSRSFGDVLAIQQYTNPKQLSAVTRRCYLWEKNLYTFTGGRSAPSNRQLEDFLIEHSDLTESTSRGQDLYTCGGKLVPVAIGGSAHWIFSQIDKGWADSFVEKLMTGTGMVEEGHPIAALRNRLSSNYRQLQRLKPNEIMALVVITWNHYITEPLPDLETILLPKGKLINENFPLPRKPKL
jgi:hypothetical protein